MPTKKQIKRRVNINFVISIVVFLITMAIISSNNLIQFLNYLGFDITSRGNAILSLFSLFIVGTYLIWSMLNKFEAKRL